MNEKAPTTASEKPKVTIDNLTAENLSDFTPQSHEEEAIALALQESSSNFTVTDNRKFDRLDTDFRTGAEVNMDAALARLESHYASPADATAEADPIFGTPGSNETVAGTTAETPAGATTPAETLTTESTSTTRTESERAPTSPIAAALKRAADYIEMSSARRQAYAENDKRTKDAQNEAYDSYADNIAFSKEKQDEITKRAKNVRRLEIEDAFATKVAGVKDKIELSHAERQAYAEDKQRTSDAQNEAYDSYADNIAYSKEKEDRILERARNVKRLEVQDNIEGKVDELRERGLRFLRKIGNAGLFIAGATLYGASKLREAGKATAEKAKSNETVRSAAEKPRLYGKRVLSIVERSRASASAAAESAKETWKIHSDQNKVDLAA